MRTVIPVRSEGTSLIAHIEKTQREFQSAWDRAHHHDLYIREVLQRANR